MRGHPSLNPIRWPKHGEATRVKPGGSALDLRPFSPVALGKKNSYDHKDRNAGNASTRVRRAGRTQEKQRRGLNSCMLRFCLSVVSFSHNLVLYRCTQQQTRKNKVARAAGLGTPNN